MSSSDYDSDDQFSSDTEEKLEILMRKMLMETPPPPTHIASLATNTVLAFLKKLPNRELCRMRRTCSYFNNLVEEHQNFLASRNLQRTEVSFGQVMVDRRDLLRQKPYLCRLFPDEFCRQMSGNEVHLLTIADIKRFTQLEKVREVLRRWHPTVNYVEVDNLTPEESLKMVDTITNNLTIRRTCIVKQDYASTQKEFLSTLSRCRNSGNIKVVSRKAFDSGAIGFFTNFKEIEFCIMKSSFRQVIQKLSALDDPQHLRLALIEVGGSLQVDMEDFDVPYSILWSQESHFPAADKHYRHDMAPIFLMEIPMRTHSMFVACCNGHRFRSLWYTAVFVPNTATSKVLELFESLEHMSFPLKRRLPSLRFRFRTKKTEEEELDIVKRIFNDLCIHGFTDKIPDGLKGCWTIRL